MKCLKCGEFFRTRGMAKVCHSCREIMREKAARKQMAICWFCENADGKCEWSGSFNPVPGWDAVPLTVKDEEGDISSYHIKSCPKYKEYK